MLYFKGNRQEEEGNAGDLHFSEWDEADAFGQAVANLEQIVEHNNSPWNLSLFEQRVLDRTEWQNNYLSSESRRGYWLQDLCLGMENHDSAVKPARQEWPFESSPYRMFGGKNLKPNSVFADEANNELFDRNFSSKYSVLAEFDETVENQNEVMSSSVSVIDTGVNTRTPERNPGRISGSSKRRPTDADTSMREKRKDRRCRVELNLSHDTICETTTKYETCHAVKGADDDEGEENASCVRQLLNDRALSTDNYKTQEHRKVETKSECGDEKQKGGGRRFAAVRDTPSRTLSCGSRDEVREKEESTCGGKDSSSDSSSPGEDNCVEGAVNSFGRCSKWTLPYKPQETRGQSCSSLDDDLERACVEPIRRGLHELLRDKVLVTREDLECRENRRFLHFLIYEHRMGVSIKELKATIAKERADHPEKEICRPSLSSKILTNSVGWMSS